jgi:membrane-associated protease RseP (regulator of RpoE activity)
MSEPSLPVSSSTVDLYQPLPVPVARPAGQRYWLHALLFLLTCFTTLVVGARMQYNFDHNHPALWLDDSSPSLFPVEWIVSHQKRLLGGLPFAGTLMLILFAHEMGHYLYCRYYGVSATLPFFIPGPPLLGTFGAFIRIRSPIRSRTALFDIGIAGPIAGFVVACAMLALSFGLTKPLPAEFLGWDTASAGPTYQDLGFPLIFHVAHRLFALATSNPTAALSLHHVMLHPMAIAAWIGMFATSLNLLPGGQLDGGHIVFSIVPRAHRLVSRLTILVLLTMGYFLWAGWLVWALLLQLSSFRHPQVAEFPRVSGWRIWLAALALLMLVLTLAPAPIQHYSLAELIRQFRRR